MTTDAVEHIAPDVTLESIIARGRAILEDHSKNWDNETFEWHVNWSDEPYSRCLEHALNGNYIDKIESPIYESAMDFSMQSFDHWMENELDECMNELESEFWDVEAWDSAEIRSTMRSLLSDGSIDNTPSFDPEIKNEARINVIIGNTDYDLVSERFLLCRLLGLSHVQFLETSYSGNYRDEIQKYMSSASIPEDFIAINNNEIDDGQIDTIRDLLFQSDQNDSGFCITLTDREMMEINRKVEEGEKVEILLNKAVLFGHDFVNGSGDYTTLNFPVFLTEDVLKRASTICRADGGYGNYGLHKTYGGYPKNVASIRESDTSPDVDLEALKIATYQRDLVRAILGANTKVIDAVISEEASRVGRLKEFMYGELVAGWSMMHFAAMIRDREDADRVMAYMSNHSVSHNVKDNTVRDYPIDTWVHSHGSDTWEITPDDLARFMDQGATISRLGQLNECVDHEVYREALAIHSASQNTNESADKYRKMRL